MPPWEDEPGLTPEINERIRESERQGGVHTADLPDGTVLAVKTSSRTYRLERQRRGWTISGHEVYCPHETPCHIHGSTWGTNMLRIGFIGVGMHLRFSVPNYAVPLTTSTIKEVIRD